MAKLSDEFNLSRIKEILEDESYSPEQEKVMREFSRYLKIKGFKVESQKTKLLHLQKLFKLIEEKELSKLSDSERKDYVAKINVNEADKSMFYFFQWYDRKTGLRDFEAIQRDERQRRIDAIRNFKEYTEEQKEIMDRFYGYLQRKGLREESKRSYLQNLKLLYRDLMKDISQVKREDIDKYLEFIGRYKKKTQSERRKFLLIFFEWYFGKKKEEIDLISDIRIKRDRSVKLPEEILSPEEIKRMVQVADNFRDKALVILLYETASRKGEFLQLKIKHIELTSQEYGLISIPQGKTDSRKLPIIYSVPHLQNWLNSHPRADDPEAPLFITNGAWLGRALGSDGLKRMLKILGRRAGIKKKIYPHLFRHSRMTELGKQLREQELNKFAGWVADSGMARVYVHLSGEDVTNKLLANAGLIDREEVENGKTVLKGIRCPRCNKVNSSDVKYCSCGFCLDLREMNRKIDEKDEDSQIMDSLKRLNKISPESLSRFIEVMAKLDEKMNK